MAIREIRGWTETTPLPHAPDYVRGVINLRGVVLPVVDLKARLGLGLTDANPKDVIVVVQAGERTIGLLVDAVSDILTVTAGEIQPTPELAREADAAFIEGIAVLVRADGHHPVHGPADRFADRRANGIGSLDGTGGAIRPGRAGGVRLHLGGFPASGAIGARRGRHHAARQQGESGLFAPVQAGARMRPGQFP